MERLSYLDIYAKYLDGNTIYDMTMGSVLLDILRVATVRIKHSSKNSI